MTDFNRCWNEVFDRYEVMKVIERNGFCTLSASELKAIKEPRLLVKQDHRNNRPDVFVENNLNILPLSRKDFQIGRVELYHDFECSWNDASENVKEVDPINVESIDFGNITSEAIAIKSMVGTNILHDFLGEEKLVDTVSGRMGSGEFNFDVNCFDCDETKSIAVKNTTIEIDAGYESPSSLCLIEAKLNMANDFLVRQLYYPFRCWSNRINKKIRPVFFVYSNGIYHLMEYEFEDKNLYNSLRQLRYKKYRIREDVRISEEDLFYLCKNCAVTDEPSVPFPQADSIERVINLCVEFANRNTPMSSEDVRIFCGFTSRQAGYYTNACIYLELVEKVDMGVFCLSPKGVELFSQGMTYKKRDLKIAELILKHKVFNECFRTRLEHGAVLDKRNYEVIMRKHKECNLGESLYARRSSTVKHWIDWVMTLVDK